MQSIRHVCILTFSLHVRNSALLPPSGRKCNNGFEGIYFLWHQVDPRVRRFCVFRSYSFAIKSAQPLHKLQVCTMWPGFPLVLDCIVIIHHIWWQPGSHSSYFMLVVQSSWDTKPEKVNQIEQPLTRETKVDRSYMGQRVILHFVDFVIWVRRQLEQVNKAQQVYYNKLRNWKHTVKGKLVVYPFIYRLPLLQSHINVFQLSPPHTPPPTSHIKTHHSL